VSWRKKFKKVAKSVKRVGTKAVRVTKKPFTEAGVRQHLSHVTKAGKVAIPLAGAIVTYYAGAAAGEAFLYGATRLQQKTAAASMRGHSSMTSHERSQKARAIANRTFKYGQVGVLAGGIASAAVAAAAPGATTGSVAAKTLLGQGGSSLLGVGQSQATSVLGPRGGSEMVYDEVGSGGWDAGSEDVAAPASEDPSAGPQGELFKSWTKPAASGTGTGSSSGGGILSNLAGLGKKLFTSDPKEGQAGEEGAPASPLAKVPKGVLIIVAVFLLYMVFNSGRGAARRRAA